MIRRQLPIGLLWGIAFLLFLGIVAAGTILFDRMTPSERDQNNRPAALGGPFALMAPDGATVTDRSLSGKPYAIFFGFTRCPDICPTSLAKMARLRKQLGPDGDRFNIVFVSIDPDHDKPADIARYLALFETPIIGLTGTEAQLEKIKTEFRVFVQKIPTAGKDYTIDHTALIYLMTADGKFFDGISQTDTDERALERLKSLISRN